ncbi:purine-nucleoside phosphorylase [Elusimicrobiota bacterium]
MNDRVIEAVSKIRSYTTAQPKVGLILGSGLGSIVEIFEESVSINFSQLPNFPQVSVEGHRGDVVLGSFSGMDVMALSGRVHYYEGYTMDEICFPVRVMNELGITRLIVTNAGGAVNEDYKTGDITIIKDHINMMGENPLRGTWDFIDMSDAYSMMLRVLAHDAAAGLEMEINEGIYLATSGPSYETASEIRMFRTMGADIVGMSTVPEVVVANSLGIEVLGLSIITNMAAGILNQKLSHKEVIDTTKRTKVRFSRLVKEILRTITQLKE